MADYKFTVLVLLVVIGLVQGHNHRHKHSSHDEDEDKPKGLSVGKTAAIAIGGGVCMALLIIAIVAIVKKCKAKPAVQPEEDKRSKTVVTPLGHTANPLYDDLPPKYSLRPQGPIKEVYLPPYPEEEKKIPPV
ncbi:uncharacterized protein LOC132755982 isoform X1 [Ruditapes philippinarum]|uniref:uncharacterized protein LOC132755982 isoform X1 n=1 Tax=Ruditapes philippinarum TaxID=129788 RepID=UPI00295B77F1|nr:uncharacterized protein LOC132755982 isoform X1 [Ruditapes philippinarum]